MKKKVLISGAGVAGMACAILLDKEKFEIDLIEQADRFRNLGFSIILWKSGWSLLMSLLQKSGVGAQEGTDYFKMDGFRVYGGSKMRHLETFTAVDYAWAFKRERLMELLEEALRKHAPAETDFSRTIRHINYEHEHGPARVVFRDGTENEYDIVVIAEGIHSPSRELVAVREKIQSEPYALRYAWFTTPTDLGTYAAVFFAEGRLAVVHPPHFQNLLGFYFEKGTSEDLQKKFEDRVKKRVKQPDGRDSVLDMKTSDIFELKGVHLDKYYSKNVVFIGDAAHGQPPTMGFGTSLALEDATVLSHKLNALTELSEESIAGALKSYSDTRMPRVENVYRLQHRIQIFYSKSHVRIIALIFLFRPFLGRFFESRIKKLASARVF